MRYFLMILAAAIPTVSVLLYPNRAEAEVSDDQIVVIEHDDGVREMGRYKITSYCICKRCCGRNARGITKSGTRADWRRNVVAVDPKIIPLGTRVHIEGVGWFTAEDVGKKVRGRHVDILTSSHYKARRWGVKRLEVSIEDKEQ